MKKTYLNAMLQVVSIKKNDIVTASETMTIYGEGTLSGGQLGADRFRDWED